MVVGETFREDICLQTFFLLFKCANHWNIRTLYFNSQLDSVGTLKSIGDVSDIFAIIGEGFLRDRLFTELRKHSKSCAYKNCFNVLHTHPPRPIPFLTVC